MNTRSPEDMTAALRDRAARGDLVLTKAELKRIAAMLEELSSRCAEAYQVVGSLATDSGEFSDPAVERALNILSDPMRRGTMLPFITAKDRARNGRARSKTVRRQKA
jgi:hypothetical protein